MRRPLALATILAAAVLFLPGCIIIPLGSFSPEYREVTVRPGHGWWPNKVLILDVDGVISASGSDGLFGSSNMVADIDEQLKLAEEDSSIKAVILRVNSPGGGVTASDLIYRRIEQFRKKTHIPVYASMMDMAASGGYYVSMAADKIYASPTTVTGSIGVIAIFPEGEGLLDKIGVKFSVIKSGQYKDMGSLFREMKPDEREILQKVIMTLYNRFVDVVSKGRPDMKPDRIRELADGRVYTAEQAQADGLIDGIAYIDQVVDKVEKAAGIQNAKVITFKRWHGATASLYAAESPGEEYAARNNWLNRLRNNTQPPSTQINLINMGGNSASNLTSYFHYLWLP